MRQSHRIIFRQTCVLLLMLVLISCSRRMSLIGNRYEQYRIDSKTLFDSNVIKHYAAYKQQLDASMSHVIGYTDVDLTKSANPETLLGNFLTEALLAEVSDSIKVDFVFATKGGLRAEIAKGIITVGAIYELMPFENKLVVLDIAGDRVADVLKFIASKEGQPVAGLRMKIKNGLPDEVFIAGDSFNVKKQYRILTYDYLANGGDGLFAFENPLQRMDLDKTVRDALIDYVKSVSKDDKHINTRLDGRIVIEK